MQDEIRGAIARVCQDLFNESVEVELSRPDEQFGDFASNVALKLAKQLGKNPREVAGAIADKLSASSLRLQDVSVAGPGFINLKLTDYALVTGLHDTPKGRGKNGQVALVEYSDPNPLKPLHAGHLYTTIVGDVIARLVERSGIKTVRLNYGGDVGLHVAKSMWAIVKELDGELPEKLNGIKAADRAQWLGDCYVKGNTAYEENETAKQEIIAVNKRVYEVHSSGDKESNFAKIYWTVRTWSYDYFASLYSQLKVTPFDRFIPESEVSQLGIDTVKAQLEKGVYKNSDGAVIFDGEPFGLHARVFINSEGLPTYEAKDVGLVLTKWRDYHFDQSIIITANEQAQYMQVVLKSIEQFEPEPAERTQHLTHGVVKLGGGVKMSSRKGNIVSALDILEAARDAGKDSGLNPDENTILAAVKYAFLKARVGGDIIYDPAEAVALEGNSGPYLQYAHARARGIMGKSKAVSSLMPDEKLQLDQPERSLARKISEFPDALAKATLEHMPHHVCSYLYELCQVFNRFYEQSKVIGDEREQLRLELVRLYADTLKDGLAILGITAPDKM